MPPTKRSDAAALGACLLAAGGLAFFFLWKFLTLKAAYLFKDIGSDSLNVLYPQLRHLFDYAATDGVPGWSFNQGLGQDIFPFSWNDPFFLVLWPFRGPGLPFGLAFMEAAKILAACAAFFLFLRETGASARAAFLGGILYAFSGYTVVGGEWSVFSTEAVHCAFLLLALERLLRRGDGRLVPPAIALIALHLPFLLFPYALFFGAYAAVRFLDEKGSKDCARFLLRFAGLSALGVAMGGILVLPDVRQVLLSPRGAGGSSLFKSMLSKSAPLPADPVQALTALLRLYSNDLLGTGSGFQGWKNYMEAPLFYCGLAPLLLAPQAFAFMDQRRRRLYGALAGAVALAVAFPFLRRALWAFSGDYYRSLSLFVVILMLFFSTRALTRLEVRPRLLAATAGLWILLLYAVPAAMRAPIDVSLRDGIAAVLIADAVLIGLLGSRRWGGLALGGLLVLACAEAGWSARHALAGRPVVTAEELSSKAGYNDETMDALAFLKARDKSFYRVEKNYRSNPTPFRGLNDAKAQGYFGTASYAQFNSPSYVSFLAETGVLDRSDELATRWLTGLRTREKLMSLAGVKYFLAREGAGPVPARFAQLPVARFGGVTVLVNRRALPLGFTADRCMTLGEFRGLDSDGKDAALLDAFVAGDEAACQGFPRFDPASVRARSTEALEIESRSQNSLRGRIALSARKMLVFAIPADGGWSARVDELEATLVRVDAGFLGLPLEAGEHRVELKFTPPLRLAGAILSLFGLGLYGVLLVRRR